MLTMPIRFFPCLINFMRPQRGCCAHLEGGAKLLGTTAPAPAFQARFDRSPSQLGVADARMSGFRIFTPANVTSSLFMVVTSKKYPCQSFSPFSSRLIAYESCSALPYA
jgi:hypothetical protein